MHHMALRILLLPMVGLLHFALAHGCHLLLAHVRYCLGQVFDDLPSGLTGVFQGCACVRR